MGTVYAVLQAPYNPLCFLDADLHLNSEGTQDVLCDLMISKVLIKYWKSMSHSTIEK